MTRQLQRRWFELAVLPLLSGIALGSSFSLGGDTHTTAKPHLRANQMALATNHTRHSVAAPSTWGLIRTESPEAWRLSRGSRNIVVAVIDTGCDIHHPDLQDNLWTNPGESGRDPWGRDKSANGLDDDGNGFIDDVHGWNFVSNNSDITDHHGHGTHIAGIIGATGKVKLSGVSPNVSLMPLKYFDPEARSVNPLNSTIKAIHYAIKMHVDIINYSGGGTSPSQQEYEALNLARKSGILVVAAAGNEQSNSDIKSYYPADYTLSNILSVTAHDPERRVLSSSNWGERTVHIAAPGENILSTLPGGGYGEMTGTSQATAFATGAAALLMANRPDLNSPEKIIEHLVHTGEFDEALAGKTRRQTTLNSYRALATFGYGVSAGGLTVENTESLDESIFTIATEKLQAEALQEVRPSQRR